MVAVSVMVLKIINLQFESILTTHSRIPIILLRFSSEIAFAKLKMKTFGTQTFVAVHGFLTCRPGA